MIWIYLYFAVLWGLFCGAMQHKLLNAYSSKWKIFTVIVVNAMLFPISLPVAVVCLTLNKGWAKCIKI